MLAINSANISSNYDIRCILFVVKYIILVLKSSSKLSNEKSCIDDLLALVYLE